MLKRRIVGVVLVKSEIAVQSIGFDVFRPIGSPTICAENLCRWGADEILLLDIEAHLKGGPSLELLSKVAKKVNVPLTYGGGVRTLSDMKAVIKGGADRLAINAHASEDIDCLRLGSDYFGSQAIVLSVDVKKIQDVYRIWNYRTKDIFREQLSEYLEKAIGLGVGEVFINSVDRDGMQNGFEIELIKQVCHTINVPVIACGGAGNYKHFEELIQQTPVAGLAAANMFNFTEHALTIIKGVLVSKGLHIRDETFFNYKKVKVNNSGRVLKRPDRELEDLLFELHVPEEI